MGKVKRVLASKKLAPFNGLNYCGIELCETVHIHLPGIRVEFPMEQFEAVAVAMTKALEKWRELGKPKTAEFVLLADAHLPGEPVYNTRFEVEEQTVPSIHIHYRGLSIRGSISDFIEFADIVCEARKNLTANQS